MARYNEAWLNEKTGEIHTPKARMGWPTLFEAKRIKDKPDSKPKFSVTLLLPKAANINLIAKGVADALKEKFGANWLKSNSVPPKSISEMLDSVNKKLNNCLLKTVDQENLAEYAEDYPFILRCSANEGFPPFVYGADAQLFHGDKSEVYAGRWAVVAGKFWAYDNVSKGVLFNLNRIQLLDHDEPIAGGRVATSEGFEQVNIGESNSGSSDDVFGAAPAGKSDTLDDEIPF